MKRTHRSLSKRLLLAAGIIVLVLAVGAGAFFWYVSDYYRAQDTALEVLAQGTGISARDGLTILSPSYATDTALIFYPGAKVEAEAYLAAAGPDSQQGRHLYSGSYALSYGDLRSGRGGGCDTAVSPDPPLVSRGTLHGRRDGLEVCLGTS